MSRKEKAFLAAAWTCAAAAGVVVPYICPSAPVDTPRVTVVYASRAVATLMLATWATAALMLPAAAAYSFRAAVAACVGAAFAAAGGCLVTPQGWLLRRTLPLLAFYVASAAWLYVGVWMIARCISRSTAVAHGATILFAALSAVSILLVNPLIGPSMEISPRLSAITLGASPTVMIPYTVGLDPIHAGWIYRLSRMADCRVLFPPTGGVILFHLIVGTFLTGAGTWVKNRRDVAGGRECPP